jgi:glycosyltransferase involved in cell wall biosynthesis
MISNFHPYKGFDFLVEILSHISVECNLTIYGEVTDFIKYFNPKQINKKVKINFRGQVNKLNNSDLANYSFAIHTSRSEGLSNAIIEELSAGLPVIAFDTGGNSELIINEINGFLIPAFDLTNFGKKIDYLLKEANSVSNLSKNSKTSIMEMSWNTIVDKHLSVYKH